MACALYLSAKERKRGRQLSTVYRGPILTLTRRVPAGTSLCLCVFCPFLFQKRLKRHRGSWSTRHVGQLWRFPAHVSVYAIIDVKGSCCARQNPIGLVPFRLSVAPETSFPCPLRSRSIEERSLNWRERSVTAGSQFSRGGRGSRREPWPLWRHGPWPRSLSFQAPALLLEEGRVWGCRWSPFSWRMCSPFLVGAALRLG